MRNINKILKMASFYSYAVSQVIDILDVNRTLDTIMEKVQNFVEKNNFTEEQQKQLSYKIIKMGQDKFNKLVAPYLKMEPVNLDINFSIPGQGSISPMFAIPFYLHDLVHETSLPGSIEKFEAKNKDGSGYSLEELIEEQVVASVSLSKGAVNQFGVYIQSKIENITSQFDFNDEITNKVEDLEQKISTSSDSQQIAEMENEATELKKQRKSVYFPELQKVLQKFFQELRNDVENVQNPKYKAIAEKFVRFLQQNYKSVDPDSIQLWNTFGGNAYQQANRLETFSRMFVNKFFSQKQNYVSPDSPERESQVQNKSEGPIADLTDDYKMSLIRRWYLAVDQEVDNILEQSRQLSFEF